MTRTTALVAAACAAATLAPAAHPDLTIFLRDSAAENDVLVGAGGAIDRSDVRVTESAFVGPLTLSDQASVQVTSGDPFSTGDAEGMTDMIFADNVSHPSPDELIITGSVDAVATLSYLGGAGLGTFRHDTETRVRFSVVDDLFAFCISGNWNPDPDATVSSEFELARLFNPNALFEATESGAFSGFGLLEPGVDYQFNARLIRNGNMSDINPSDSAATQYDFVLHVFQYIPCDADVVPDGTVDLEDLLLVLANFGTATGDGDTNSDGQVELDDLLTVLSEFGNDCDVCAPAP